MDFIRILNYYIRAELIVLIPVLYLLNALLRRTKVKVTKIPMILLGVSLGISGIYTASVCEITNWRDIFSCLFSVLTQGIILAGASCFTKEIFTTTIKCLKKEQKDDSVEKLLSLLIQSKQDLSVASDCENNKNEDIE